MADRRRLGVQDALWLEMDRPDITNVPGPPMPVYLAGSKVEAMAGWAPVSGNQAMSFTIYSYDGKVTVGIACDMSLVPDHETVVDGFAVAFDRLLAATPGVTR